MHYLDNKVFEINKRSKIIEPMSTYKEWSLSQNNEDNGLHGHWKTQSYQMPIFTHSSPNSIPRLATLSRLYYSLLSCAWSCAVLDVQIWGPWLPKFPSFRPHIFVLHFSFYCINKISSSKTLNIKKSSLKSIKNSNV